MLVCLLVEELPPMAASNLIMLLLSLIQCTLYIASAAGLDSLVTPSVTPDGVILCNQPLTVNFTQTSVVIPKYYQFILDTSTQNVLFSNCETQYDTKLYVYDTYGTEISSTNGNCNGADCGSCINNNNEQFTIPQMIHGIYTVQMEPYNKNYYGEYKILIICPTPTPTIDHTNEPIHKPSTANTPTNEPTHLQTMYVIIIFPIGIVMLIIAICCVMCTRKQTKTVTQKDSINEVNDTMPPTDNNNQNTDVFVQLQTVTKQLSKNDL